MDAKQLIYTYAQRMAQQGRPVYGLFAEGTNAPLLPYFAGDIILSIYNAHLASLPASHEFKQARNRWRKAYTAFNAPFFACFNEQERDEVIDYMDAFEKQVGNAVEICRLNLLDYCPESLPFEKRMALSYMMLANVLATGAQGLWNVAYRKRPRAAIIGGVRQIVTERSDNQHLAAMKKYAYDMMVAYCPALRTHQVESMDGFYKAWDGLCNKIAQFVGE